MERLTDGIVMVIKLEKWLQVSYPTSFLGWQSDEREAMIVASNDSGRRCIRTSTRKLGEGLMRDTLVAGREWALSTMGGPALFLSLLQKMRPSVV